MMSEIGNMKRDRVRNCNITPLLSLKLPQLQPSLSPHNCKRLLLGRYPPPLLPPRICDASRIHVDHVPNIFRMTHTLDSRSLHVLAYRGDTCHTNLGCVRLVECGRCPWRRWLLPAC